MTMTYEAFRGIRVRTTCITYSRATRQTACACSTNTATANTTTGFVRFHQIKFRTCSCRVRMFGFRTCTAAASSMIRGSTIATTTWHGLCNQ